MINKAQKTILAGILALSIGLLPALAQVSTTGSLETTTSAQERKNSARGERERPPEPDSHRERRNVDNDRGGDRDRGDRDRRHYDPEAFRQMMNETLNEVPTLNKRMVRLQDIQAQRFELQKQRQAVARAKDSTREIVVRKFHVLLKQDQTLSDEARVIVKGIVSDMPQIQRQLDQRRAILTGELDKANTAHTDPATSSPEARELRRKLKYVDFLEKKLGDLQTHPERLDLLARVLRGLPPDDPLGDTDESDRRRGDHDKTPEQRLADLLLKRQRLQRELHQVDNEIQHLRKQGVNEQPSEPAAE